MNATAPGRWEKEKNFLCKMFILLTAWRKFNSIFVACLCVWVCLCVRACTCHCKYNMLFIQKLERFDSRSILHSADLTDDFEFLEDQTKHKHANIEDVIVVADNNTSGHFCNIWTVIDIFLTYVQYQFSFLLSVWISKQPVDALCFVQHNIFPQNKLFLKLFI